MSRPLPLMPADVRALSDAVQQAAVRQLGTQWDREEITAAVVVFTQLSGQLIGDGWAHESDSVFANMIRDINDLLWTAIRDGQRRHACRPKRRTRKMGTTRTP